MFPFYCTSTFRIQGMVLCGKVYYVIVEQQFNSSFTHTHNSSTLNSLLLKIISIYAIVEVCENVKILQLNEYGKSNLTDLIPFIWRIMFKVNIQERKIVRDGVFKT